MQFAVITGPDLLGAKRRILAANQKKIGVELRLDLLKNWTPQDIKELKYICKGPMIYTLRSTSQGGNSSLDLRERIEYIQALLPHSPEYIDVSYEDFPLLIETHPNPYPPTKWIISYHNFQATPIDLEQIFQKMYHEDGYAYKLCTTANTPSDGYRMLRFVQKKTKESYHMIGICMGDHGAITRKEGCKAGNILNYVILHTKDYVAPGLNFA